LNDYYTYIINRILPGDKPDDDLLFFGHAYFDDKRKFYSYITTALTCNIKRTPRHLTTRNAWQSLANSPLGATVSPPSK